MKRHTGVCIGRLMDMMRDLNYTTRHHGQQDEEKMVVWLENSLLCDWAEGFWERRDDERQNFEPISRAFSYERGAPEL